MSTAANDSKQITIAAVLGVVLVGVLVRGFIVVNAPTDPPKAPPVTDSAVNNPGAQIAAPTVAAATQNTAPAGSAAAAPQGAPGAIAMAQVGAQGGLFLLQPSELRNPFTPPAIAMIKPVDTGKSSVPAAAPSHPTLITPMGSMPPAIPSHALWMDAAGHGGNSLPPTTGASRTAQGSKPVHVHVPTPQELFEADIATLKASVAIKGVLVGTPSIAFITVNGKEQTVSVGDPLPAGFIVHDISNEGVVASYSHGKLNQTISIGF